MDVGDLISGPSAFSKSNLHICKFAVHILFKLNLMDFEHYLAGMWNEHNCAVVWTCFLTLPFFGMDWKLTISGPIFLLSFSNLLAYWIQNFNSKSFRIWNSSTGIPSLPVALLIAMLPKAHLTSHSRISGCRWVPTPSWSSGLLKKKNFV